MVKAVYQNLSRDIERYIAEHNLHGKLPGLHQLSKIFHFHHVTVRKALELLAAEGKLEVQPSRGIFILEKKPRPRTGFIGVTGYWNCDAMERNNILDSLNEKLAPLNLKLLSISDNRTVFRENPRLLLQFPVDGYIFLGGSISRPALECLLENHMPIICSHVPDFPFVNHIGMDYRDAYARVVRILKKRFRRIAFCEFMRPLDFAFFLEDIRRIFQRELGSRFEPELFTTADSRHYYACYGDDYYRALAEDVLKKWGKNPPDALVTCDGFSDAFHEMLPALPLAVFGKRQRIPDMISVSYDSAVIVEKAARRMAEILNGDRKIVQTLLPYDIIIPESMKQRMRRAGKIPAQSGCRSPAAAGSPTPMTSPDQCPNHNTP